MSDAAHPFHSVPDAPLCRIVSEPIDVARRLHELGLKEEILLETMKAWARGWNSVGPFAPLNAAGTEAWMRATETLRELLSMEGWKKNDWGGRLLHRFAERQVVVDGL